MSDNATILIALSIGAAFVVVLAVIVLASEHLDARRPNNQHTEQED